MKISWDDFKEKVFKYLTAAGSGVYTIATASDKKRETQNLIYKDCVSAEDAWKKSWDKIEDSKGPFVLGICSDNGGGIIRGANWGPLFIRNAMAKQFNYYWSDLGDIRVIPHLLCDQYVSNKTINSCRNALYGDENCKLPVSPLSIAEDFLTDFYHLHSNPKIMGLGGDHSVSYPLVKTYLKAAKLKDKKVALIHFDAHTDLLEQRLGIDICFGSWLSHVLCELEDPSLAIQVGIRSSANDKEYWQSKYGVVQFWSDEVIKRGEGEVAKDILKHLKEKNVNELYVSFDIDALDSQYASATGTPEAGGITAHQAIVILKSLQKEFPITGADLVEVAPFINHGLDCQPEPMTTLLSAENIATFLLKSLAL